MVVVGGQGGRIPRDFRAMVAGSPQRRRNLVFSLSPSLFSCLSCRRWFALSSSTVSQEGKGVSILRRKIIVGSVQASE
eukprot:scaffold926_cov163-Amphora_coffeaeformis.AAC.4